MTSAFASVGRAIRLLSNLTYNKLALCGEKIVEEISLS